MATAECGAPHKERNKACREDKVCGEVSDKKPPAVGGSLHTGGVSERGFCW